MRLDKFLIKKHPGYSRSVLQKLIKSGKVTVGGVTVDSPKKAVAASAVVAVELPSDRNNFDKTLPVVYEDDNIVVLDKPAGILTHAKGALNDEFTVASFLQRYWPNRDSNRAGIVHRLDRGTSGVMIGAKNLETEKFLKQQFSERKVKKTYLAVVEGIPKEAEAIIDVPIGRNPKKPAEFRPDINGKSAVTKYRVLAVNEQKQALVELQPETGRTHQLRVHMQFIGTPILGDVVYGSGKKAARMFLHAQSLEITVPSQPHSQRKLFTAPAPDAFKEGFSGV